VNTTLTAYGLYADEASGAKRGGNPPPYLEIARIEASTSPSDVPQRTRSVNISTKLGSLSAGLAQVFKTYWWVPAGFAVLVLVRSILGG
jgi:hypothetical protein